MQARNKKLAAAHEIHKFNRDAKEVKGRVITKENSIPQELGRSIAAVQVLQRKHEAFEREIAAIGNKVCVVWLHICNSVSNECTKNVL